MAKVVARGHHTIRGKQYRAGAPAPITTTLLFQAVRSPAIRSKASRSLARPMM